MEGDRNFPSLKDTWFYRVTNRLCIELDCTAMQAVSCLPNAVVEDTNRFVSWEMRFVSKKNSFSFEITAFFLHFQFGIVAKSDKELLIRGFCVFVFVFLLFTVFQVLRARSGGVYTVFLDLF